MPPASAAACWCLCLFRVASASPPAPPAGLGQAGDLPGLGVGAWADTYDFAYVDGAKGKDAPGCGTRASPCRSIPQGVGTGAAKVIVASGTYQPAPGEDPYVTIERPVAITTDGGSATVDCGNAGSAMDVLVSSGMEVSVEGLVFVNCTGVNKTHPNSAVLRPWGIGGTTIGDWCKSCYCSLVHCSRAGGVTIVHKLYPYYDSYWTASNTSVLAPLEDVHVSFRGCSWYGNSATQGGAVQLMFFVNYTRSSFSFRDCVFQGNYLAGGEWGSSSFPFGQGSAIVVEQETAFNYMQRHTELSPWTLANSTLIDTNITLDNCTIKENLNNYSDGTVSLWMNVGLGSDFLLEISDSHFVDNVVAHSGGGLNVFGLVPLDASYEGRNNTYRLLRTEFSRNRGSLLTGSAGAAQIGNFPLSEVNNTEFNKLHRHFRAYNYHTVVEVTDCVFDSNVNDVGGAYASGNGYHIIRGTSFTNNWAQGTGGAIHLGTGDAGIEFHDSFFRNNTANRLCHTFSQSGNGPSHFENTTFELHGSDRGVSDVCMTDVGAAYVDAHTTFVCPAGTVLQNPSGKVTSQQGGFELRYTGTLRPDCSYTMQLWNRAALDATLNSFLLACSVCPAGRYNLLQPTLSGPFHSDVDPGGDAKPNQLFGDISGQSSQIPVEACRECPFGGECKYGNSVSPRGIQVYGYDVTSVEANKSMVQVYFAKCPRGSCVRQAKSWQETCLPHRQGTLCGNCSPGYQEAWFGGYPCIPAEDCNSWWWAVPLSLVAFLLYAAYIYSSSQSCLHGRVDVWLLFFQTFTFVSMDSWGGFQANVLRFLNLNLRAGGAEEVTWAAKHACLAPGLTAYGRIWIGLVPAVALPLGILLVHKLAMRWQRLHFLLPEEHATVPPLTAGFVKAYLYIYSFSVQALFALMKCSDIRSAAGSHSVLTYAGGVSCGPWQYIILILVVLVVPSPLVPIALAASPRGPAGLAMQHIQEREVTVGGLKEHFWWWSFALTMFRGVIAILPGIVRDEASLALTNFVIVLGMLVAVQFAAPFTRVAMTVQEAIAFALLACIAGTTTGGAVLAQGELRLNEYLVGYDTYRRVVGIACVFLAGAALIQGILLVPTIKRYLLLMLRLRLRQTRAHVPQDC